MCGIAGIFSNDPRRAASIARAMNDAQCHRGPDDAGIESYSLGESTVVLAHRRLSIVDLSPAGHQPMINPVTGDSIIFNGEIYNFLELRRDLEKLGEQFRSHTDTEVILKIFEHFGEAGFEKLYGMFAFAIFSPSRGELIVARDPLGIKPIYFTWHNNSFAFASETRALVNSGAASREIDTRAMATMLAFGAVQHPLTMYKSIKSLEPGTWAAIGVKSLSSREFTRTGRHWDFPAPNEKISEADAVERLRGALSATASSHLIADVPVGLFLSSGIDSTAIAALCAESRRNLDAFSVRLSDRPEMDESASAARTAQMLGLRHHIIDLSEEQVRNQAQAWLAAQDQPSMDGLNTFVISKAVRERGVVVALSGLGGDELFGGYPSFRDVPRMMSLRRRAGLLPQRVQRLAAHFAYLSKSYAQRQKAFETLNTPPTVEAMCFRRRRILTDSELTGLGLNAQSLELSDDYVPPESDPHHALPKDDVSAAVSVLETRYFMSNTLLRDTDVCGMAHSLELRVPLLDRHVIDCAFSLPGALRVPPRSAVSKPLLVQALGERLPAHILNLKKRGFNLSQSNWMSGPLRPQFESALSALKKSGCVDAQTVEHIWSKFLEEHAGPDWARPWTLGVLGAWFEREREARA